ncbi:LysR family transcriptional regulator [Streptococcus ovuberis]|uniref:LysR family transcriptional regulator n=1 Tax=Streptococcus ovuberis TaxID=1936207 RepID=A0A7X6MY32_9STRE|nr:LysR family transcriptional regulator [Streptococcus ovuberis]NKZ19883.1 LysR family transcriptional regulator [Streptococcus ovuberis]
MTYTENRLLEILVLFAKLGSLSATAEALLLTQPTITRSMQRLEEELAVQLFIRTPNRLELTETGKLAAQKAEVLLKEHKQFVKELRQFEQEQHQVVLSSTAPGPIYLFQENESLRATMDETIIAQSQVEQALLSHRFSLVFTTEELFTDQIESLYIGEEILSVHLDAKMVAADVETTTFRTLANTSFLTMSGLGEWADVVRKEIPNGKFLKQDNRETFQEILQHSNLAYFSTNLSGNSTKNNHRKKLLITDERASLPFYMTYLISEKERLAPLIQELKRTWPVTH